MTIPSTSRALYVACMTLSVIDAIILAYVAVLLVQNQLNYVTEPVHNDPWSGLGIFMNWLVFGTIGVPTILYCIKYTYGHIKKGRRKVVQLISLYSLLLLASTPIIFLACTVFISAFHSISL